MARKIGSRYSIDRVIGRGTCGTVWLGTGPHGPVAVKLLREDLAADQTLIARFVQERTVLTSLVHPHIVAIRDLVVDGTDLALIMDLVEGEDLRGYLDRERSLRPAEAAALAGDIAAALAAAHARGVVHRDVKPENVLLDQGRPAPDPDAETGTGAAAGKDAVGKDAAGKDAAGKDSGTALISGPNSGKGGAKNEGKGDGKDTGPARGPGTARLTDFGIARLVDGPRRTRATRIVGTPDYLAPEVIEGCLPGPPVDVYALGTVLFELLTGWTPFGGGHPGAVLRRHVTESVPEVPGMPKELLELLNACLSKAPAARLTAAEVTGRLRTLAPKLAGLPALRVADPRAAPLGPGEGDPAFGRPITVGALPLVRAMIEDEGKQTHVNLIRPIKEPLGPSAPIPRTAGSGAGSGGTGGHPVPAGAPGSSTASSSAPAASAWSNRIAAVAAVIAAGLVIAGGALWWNDSHGQRAAGAGSAGSITAAAVGAAVTPTGNQAGAGSLAAAAAPAGPVGPLGLVRLAAAPAPPAKPVGAVAYTSTDAGIGVLAATGVDGVVRVAVAPRGHAFTGWRPLPGLSSSAAPSLVPDASGQAELFAVSSGGGQVERAVYRGGAWSPWAEVAADGASGVRFVGNPAAVALPDGRTHLLAVSDSGDLWSTTGTEASDGSASWTDWHVIDAAGPVKPGLALAARPDGTMAAFVTRASDAAVLRVVDDGGWEAAWPTGAVGQPAAAYTSGGKPYLFVQAITGDIQVFEPSGADLHGTMDWITAGVTTQNPPGVADSGSAITITAVAADGTVGVYTTTA